MLSIKVDYQKRIYGFDLLRAIAIFAVIHGHGQHLLLGTLLEGFPWIPLPRGVDAFFVLSGFLLAMGFFKKFGAAASNGQEHIFTFWKRAALRIFPNYYLMLLVNFLLLQEALIPGSLDDFGIGLFLTFTQNLYSFFYGFYYESWSLGVQVWFYLSFPLLLWWSSRWWGMKRATLVLVLLALVIAFSYRYFTVEPNFEYFWWDVKMRKVALSRMDSIYIGVLAAWLRNYYPSIWTGYRWLWLTIAVCIYAFIGIQPRSMNTLYTNYVYFTLSPISIALFLPILDRLKDVRGPLGAAVTKLGILSYALYLVNLLLIQIIDMHFESVLVEQATLKYLLFWLAALAISYLLFITIEQPISNLRSRIGSSRP